MQCPKCENATIKSGKLKSTDLVLENCPKCKGMWFDENELSAVLAKSAETEFCIPMFSMEVPDAQCPKCEVSLYEFCYPGTLVVVDGCNQCKGVWLDNKEWKAIKNARDGGKNIICPKCETTQVPTEVCIQCSVDIENYNPDAEISKYNPDFTANKSALRTENSKLDDLSSTYAVYSSSDKSYADDIPGLKGEMLRNIERWIIRYSW